MQTKSLLTFLAIIVVTQSFGFVLDIGKNTKKQTKVCSRPLILPSELKETLLKQLGITESEIRDDLWAEKALPYAEMQTVVVVPKILDDTEGSETLDAMILVVNSKTGKIIQKMEDANTVFSDAVYISKFTIDTAPYLLTKETRAFGIRATYYGSSGPNPYKEVQLSLFVQKGGILKQVLKDLIVESSSGEWNMDCDGRFEDTKSILLFETGTTNGYFNVVVKERSSVTLSERIKGECKDKIIHNPEKKRILRYDGETYH